MTYKQAIHAWYHNNKANAGTVSTDGNVIKSYARVIGYTDTNGDKVALRSNDTVTTTRHCNAVAKAADVVRNNVYGHNACSHYPCEHTPNAR